MRHGVRVVDTLDPEHASLGREPARDKASRARLLLLHGGEDGLEDGGRVGVEVIAGAQQDQGAHEHRWAHDEEGDAQVVG